MLLGRLLIGIAAAAIGAIAVAVTVKCVRGILDRRKLANLARQDGLRNAIVDTIERCNNKVTLKDLDSKTKVSYQSSAGIGRDVEVGMYV